MRTKTIFIQRMRNWAIDHRKVKVRERKFDGGKSPAGEGEKEREKETVKVRKKDTNRDWDEEVRKVSQRSLHS